MLLIQPSPLPPSLPPSLPRPPGVQPIILSDVVEPVLKEVTAQYGVPNYTLDGDEVRPSLPSLPPSLPPLLASPAFLPSHPRHRAHQNEYHISLFPQHFFF